MLLESSLASAAGRLRRWSRRRLLRALGHASTRCAPSRARRLLGSGRRCREYSSEPC